MANASISCGSRSSRNPGSRASGRMPSIRKAAGRSGTTPPPTNGWTSYWSASNSSPSTWTCAPGSRLLRTASTSQASTVAGCSSRSLRRLCPRGNSRCSRAASTRDSRHPCSRGLRLQGRPQPLLKIEFLIENPLHEQHDLSLGIEAVAAAVLPESREHLAIHADVELDLFRGLRDDGSRHGSLSFPTYFIVSTETANP